MSSSNDIVLPRNFDISNLTYGPLKQLTSGGKTIYLSYSGKNLLMQTPFMKAPFGIKKWDGESGAPDKYNLDLSLEGSETNETIGQFFSALKAIDQRMLNDAFENSQLWFKKKYPSIEVIEALYTPTVKYSKDRDTGEINNKYAPTFKMLLPMKDGEFTCTAFGPGARPTELNLAEIIQSGRSKSARIQAIVQCSSIWMVGTKFGVSWKVRQLRIEEPARLPSFAFIKDGNDIDDCDDDDATDEECAAKFKGLVMAESDDEQGATSSALHSSDIKSEPPL